VPSSKSVSTNPPLSRVSRSKLNSSPISQHSLPSSSLSPAVPTPPISPGPPTNLSVIALFPSLQFPPPTPPTTATNSLPSSNNFPFATNSSKPTKWTMPPTAPTPVTAATSA